MNQNKIDKKFHDLNSLIDPGAAPLIVPGDQLIAGEDDRKDVHQLSNTGEDALHRKLVASTVILTDKTRLSKNADGSWTLNVEEFRRSGLPPCTGESFGNQKTGGWCSGFLVGSDVIVTAGHCGESEADIRNTAYVFGFQAATKTDPGTTEFQPNQVYFGKELIAHDLSTSGDFAIVRVDRAVTAPCADPLSVRATGNPTIGSNLGVIGYPSGLPVKVAFGTDTVLIRDQDPWLISNLDTYGGNSGSPVFNTDGEVEGILVRGAQDYILESTCFRSNTIDNSDGSEAVTKASVFQAKIP